MSVTSQLWSRTNSTDGSSATTNPVQGQFEDFVITWERKHGLLVTRSDGISTPIPSDFALRAELQHIRCHFCVNGPNICQPRSKWLTKCRTAGCRGWYCQTHLPVYGVTMTGGSNVSEAQLLALIKQGTTLGPFVCRSCRGTCCCSPTNDLCKNAGDKHCATFGQDSHKCEKVRHRVYNTTKRKQNKTRVDAQLKGDALLHVATLAQVLLIHEGSDQRLRRRRENDDDDDDDDGEDDDEDDDEEEEEEQERDQQGKSSKSNRVVGERWSGGSDGSEDMVVTTSSSSSPSSLTGTLGEEVPSPSSYKRRGRPKKKDLDDESRRGSNSSNSSNSSNGGNGGGGGGSGGGRRRRSSESGSSRGTSDGGSNGRGPTPATSGHENSFPVRGGSSQGQLTEGGRRSDSHDACPHHGFDHGSEGEVGDGAQEQDVSLRRTVSRGVSKTTTKTNAGGGRRVTNKVRLAALVQKYEHEEVSPRSVPGSPSATTVVSSEEEGFLCESERQHQGSSFAASSSLPLPPSSTSHYSQQQRVPSPSIGTTPSPPLPLYHPHGHQDAVPVVEGTLKHTRSGGDEAEPLYSPRHMDVVMSILRLQSDSGVVPV